MKKVTSYLLLIIGFALLFSTVSFSQIYEPEGLNMPGGFNGWTNPPIIDAFAGIQRPTGKLLVNTELPTRRYKTLIYVAASGGDAIAGTYPWLFTSGPTGSPYNNKWSNVIVQMNTLQSYTFQHGTDNSVTLVNDKYYTVHWRDNGYQNTSGIWMATSGEPVQLTSVTQSPLAGSVLPDQSVTVTVVTNVNKSAEELMYIRYTANNWVSSSLAPVSFVGNSGTATLPGQTGGTTVRYYAFSTTVSNPTSDFDMYTINHNNNSGLFYSYSVLSPTYTIASSAGLNGIILPAGDVIVNHGSNQQFIITPNSGFYVDSLIVDGAKTDSTTSYTFNNVTANHTIRAVFAYKVNVTFRVNMKAQMKMDRFKPELGDYVTVRGSLNNWGNPPNGNLDTLTDADNDSIYTKTIPIKAEQTIYFKYWKSPRGGLEWEDAIGDRELAVGNSDTQTPVVLFNNEDIPVFVTFQVNMKVQMNKGKFIPSLGDAVTVRGSFNSWSTIDTLKDLDNDSIYTKTIPISKNQTINYKFWKTFRADVDWESFFGDRIFNLTDIDVTIPPVYFNNEFPDVNVTFQVNMKIKMIEKNFLPELGDVLTVRGSFNDWGNSTNNPDTLYDADNDSIYTKVIPISGNQTIYYKFWKSERAGMGFENDPERQHLLLLDDEALPIVYFDRDETVDMGLVTVSHGWNMVSVPVTVYDFRKSVLFETAQSNAFTFHGSYFIKDTLTNGPGYWLKFIGEQSINMIGTLISALTIDVTPGWNMIGAISSPVSIGSIIQDPENNISSPYYGYNNGYQIADNITPGKAYWIKVKQAGQLQLNSGGLVSKQTKTEINKNEIEITDAVGNRQKLMFGEADNLSLSFYELPPMPPSGIFDVRFATGSMFAANKENVILISDAEYPIKISWTHDKSVNAKLIVDGNEVSMNKQNSLEITKPVSMMILKFESGSFIPNQYALEQNYPNPFNPTTIINYQLPIDNWVTLKVYDVLGREVATLVDEFKDSGYYEATWDATNIPSGVFFYRMQTGSFSETKKLILMR
ncbi:MAG: T9SS type A sorting domain-containing protein [Bacteroidota bacterium]|nr:T9SS type A sorting domain-containing protein [Bacteroidota bacterium]